MPIENPHNFSNGPMQPYLLQQQQPIGRPHTDYLGNELKDMPWEGGRAAMNDIQDKSQHVCNL